MKKLIFWTGVILPIILAAHTVFAAERIRAAKGPDAGILKAPRAERPGGDQKERVRGEG